MHRRDGAVSRSIVGRGVGVNPNVRKPECASTSRLNGCSRCDGST
jgi:hypothetical protein